MSDDRVLDLQGVHNFRDYGGYAVAGGGRVRRGVLWRSGQHHGATDADLAAIAALDLRDVFDLRHDGERATHPFRRPEGFAARIFETASPPPRADRHSAPHIAAAQVRRERTPQGTFEGLVRNYGKIAFRPELQASIKALLARLAQGEGASLVNCMAGKDRTGIAVAMVHSALGVHRDDILTDYLLTNTAGDPEARIRSGGETVRAISGPIDDDVLRVLMGVEAEYLAAMFAAVESEHGSVDAYLAEVLGADVALRERLRAALVES